MKCGICQKEFTGRFWSLKQECKIHPRYKIDTKVVCEKCAFHICVMFDYLHGTIERQSLIDDFLDCDE